VALLALVALGAIGWTGARASSESDSPSSAIGEALSRAAAAGQRGDLAEARRLLAPFVAPPASGLDATRARTLLGWLAYTHDDPRFAAELLDENGGFPGLEDWRLFALGDARSAASSVAPAREAFRELLARFPDSPLRARTLIRLTELAGRAGDLRAVTDTLAQGRAERLPPADQIELERVAWKIGLDRGAQDLLDGSARRLLVLAPLEASRLRVVDVLTARQRAGGSDWRLWLTEPELLRRAEALIEADLPAGAITTLAGVRSENRNLEWQLLEARALTESGRSVEALTQLDSVAAGNAADSARLELARAQAAGAAANARRGSAVAPAARERYRQLEREHLLGVVRAGGDPDLSIQALDRLAADYLTSESYLEAVTALRQLAALRPGDSTGARPLFDRGWEAFARGDRARATVLWRDTAALYPGSTSARAARYWTARSLEAERDTEAARAIYRDLATVGTADFYARQARSRLAGEAPTVSAPPVERQSWPRDPRLGRAEQLADLGLDSLATREIELVGDRADPRAESALTALLLSHRGERRASLNELRRAFPELGTTEQASVPTEALALYYPVDYRDAVMRAAAATGLAPSLVFGIVHQESAFDAGAQSHSGARGLMQLMPSTGRELARRLQLPFSLSRLHDPGYSLQLGTAYFRQMLGMFDGRVELALAGYNGGPGRISRLWRAAGPQAELDRFLEGLSVGESKVYVKRILLLADSYRSLYPDLG
jgi:soluble lytic murein transglycosylase-like protein